MMFVVGIIPAESCANLNMCNTQFSTDLEFIVTPEFS